VLRVAAAGYLSDVKMARAPRDTAAGQPKEAGWRRVVFRGPDGEQIELRG